MAEKVDHYGSQYGHFVSDLYATIRSETYDEDIGQNGWLTAEEQNLFINWLSLAGPKQRLLDIACGSGGPTMRVAEITGCSAIGVDIHADAISTAQESAAKSNLGDRVMFKQADGSQGLDFDSESFDALMCIDAINHLPDRPSVLAEWYRILRPEGHLVFTDPIVVTGPLTNEEIAVRASIGFFLFVPEGTDDQMLDHAGLSIEHKEDRSDNMALMAARWARAREKRESELRKIEGDSNYEGQQAFFDVCARLASDGRLSRFAYHAVKN